MTQPTYLMFDQLQAANPTYKKAWGQARAAAAGRAQMLLRGLVGTGRRTLARAVHLESPRREGPFVAACATSEERTTPRWIDEQLARAQGGTLYLSDILDLYWEADSHLFERLADGVDVRLIASTRRVALDFELGRMGLRDDANQVVIDLPPLYDRPEDVVPLFLRFASEAARHAGRPDIETCSETVQRVVSEYAWPGNLLELRHVASMAAWSASGGAVEVGDLAIEGAAETREPVVPLPTDRETQVLRRHVLHLLRRYRGDVHRAAAAFGVSRSAMYERMRHYGISPAGGRDPR